MQLPRWDDPEKIVEQNIENQHLLLSGYRGNPAVNPKKLREAYQPSQVAISLTGEPTLYAPLRTDSYLSSERMHDFLSD
jgi:tRNA wybutosine-synthesizing protein 1